MAKAAQQKSAKSFESKWPDTSDFPRSMQASARLGLKRPPRASIDPSPAKHRGPATAHSTSAPAKELQNACVQNKVCLKKNKNLPARSIGGSCGRRGEIGLSGQPDVSDIRPALKTELCRIRGATIGNDELTRLPTRRPRQGLGYRQNMVELISDDQDDTDARVRAGQAFEPFPAKFLSEDRGRQGKLSPSFRGWIFCCQAAKPTF